MRLRKGLINLNRHDCHVTLTCNILDKDRGIVNRRMSRNRFFFSSFCRSLKGVSLFG